MQPITVDHDSPTPPYEQVREQIRSRVDAGSLAPGTKLPTVRGLASDLGLAANTIARAYRELEGLGVIETRGRAAAWSPGQAPTALPGRPPTSSPRSSGRSASSRPRPSPWSGAPSAESATRA